MGFTHVQPTAYTQGSFATLAAPPTVGNLVCVSFLAFTGITLLEIRDNNFNTYNVSPNSPARQVDADDGSIWLAYWIATGTPSATIAADTTSTPTFSSIYVDEFAFTGLVPTLDTDNSGGGTGTVVNTPALSVAGAGELLYCGATVDHTITGTGSPWIQNDNGPGGFGENAAYILNSSSGSIPLNFPVNTSGAWGAMSMAFKQGSGIYSIEDYGQVISFGLR